MKTDFEVINAEPQVKLELTLDRKEAQTLRALFDADNNLIVSCVSNGSKKRDMVCPNESYVNALAYAIWDALDDAIDEIQMQTK